MPKRQFRDADGTYWDVWDVHPTDYSVGRSGYDRRSSSRTDAEAIERVVELGPMLDPTLEDGWLCFQAGTTRRRFAPIPPAWSELPDGVLRVMLDIAVPVRATADRATAPSARAEA